VYVEFLIIVEDVKRTTRRVFYIKMIFEELSSQVDSSLLHDVDCRFYDRFVVVYFCVVFVIGE